MKTPDFKSLAIIAAAAAGVYVVYKLFGLGKGAADSIAAVFTKAKDTRPASQRVTLAATARNAVEQQLLNGQITVDQAERALYPERFAKTTTTTTDAYGTLTHVGAGTGIGGTISIPNQNPYLR